MEKLQGFENSNQEYSEKEFREQGTDALLRFLDTAENAKFLHDKKFEEIFADEESKRDFVDNLEIEEFIELLNTFNGILRNKEKEEWRMDGETVALVGFVDGAIPPQHEDKPELLAKVLSVAKEMNQNKKDLKDIALLFSSSINAIHSYADGNGRTSRLIYSLFTQDFNDETKKELKEVLLEGGREKININPGFIEGEIEDLVGIKEPNISKGEIAQFWRDDKVGKRKDIKFNQEINKADKELFFNRLDKDNEYFFWSVVKYLQDNSDINREKCLKEIPNSSNNAMAIPISILSKSLDNEKLNKIFQNYRDLKKEYVEKLIDSIANPDKKEYQIEIKGQKISIKDYFESKIKEEQER
ncbi:MAG: Fic family protein [Patescibacteria group bacterium]|nr:Fic family protein [Patescibacteria group bacterium]